MKPGHTAYLWFLCTFSACGAGDTGVRIIPTDADAEPIDTGPIIAVSSRGNDFWFATRDGLYAVDESDRVEPLGARAVGGLLETEDGRLFGCYSEDWTAYLAEWEDGDWVPSPIGTIQNACDSGEFEECFSEIRARCRLRESGGEIVALFQRAHGSYFHDEDFSRTYIGTAAGGWRAEIPTGVGVLGFGWGGEDLILFRDDQEVHYVSPDDGSEPAVLLGKDVSAFAGSRERAVLVHRVWEDAGAEQGFDLYDDSRGVALDTPYRSYRFPVGDDDGFTHKSWVSEMKVAVVGAEVVTAYVERKGFVIGTDHSSLRHEVGGRARTVERLLASKDRVYLVYFLDGGSERLMKSFDVIPEDAFP